MSEHEEALHDEAQEIRALRDAEDRGGHRRVAGRLLDVADLPSGEDLL